MRSQITAILSMSACLVLCTQASAVTVHTWRDASGVTHFSDEPSPEGLESATLELDALNKSGTPEKEDFYSIANQWKRMKAERDATSSRKLEKQKLKAAERQRITALELQASQQSNSHSEAYLPTYPLYGTGFQGRNGGGHYQPGYGLPSIGRQGRGYSDRHSNGRQARHPNYYSPFHDRSQPQSIRPKSFNRNRGGSQIGGSSGRGRSHAQGSLIVRF